MTTCLKVDIRQLKALQKQIEHLYQGELEQISVATLKELAARMLRQVSKRTPVATGTLRRNWTVGAVVKNGNSFEIEVINSTDYAAYVEYGHRTANRRGWVPGSFMMTVSAQELERDAPKIIERKLRSFLAKELSKK